MKLSRIDLAETFNRDKELGFAELRGKMSMAESITKLMTPSENIRFLKRVFKLAKTARDNTVPSRKRKRRKTNRVAKGVTTSR